MGHDKSISALSAYLPCLSTSRLLESMLISSTHPAAVPLLKHCAQIVLLWVITTAPVYLTPSWMKLFLSVNNTSSDMANGTLVRLVI